ncbi:MAG: hypothetical protein ACFCUG_02820 [Thiotrichales bacterium]
MSEYFPEDAIGLPDLPFVPDFELSARVDLQRLAARSAGFARCFHDTLRDRSAGPILCVITPGMFQIRAPPQTFGFKPDEGAQLYVSVTRAGTRTPFTFCDHLSCREVHFNALFPYAHARLNRRWFLPRCMPWPKAVAVASLP